MQYITGILVQVLSQVLGVSQLIRELYVSWKLTGS